MIDYWWLVYSLELMQREARAPSEWILSWSRVLCLLVAGSLLLFVANFGKNKVHWMGAQLISQGLEVSANSVFQDTHVFWIPMADRACKMFHCLFLNTILLSRIVNHQCSNKIKLDLILCFKNKQIFQSPFYNFCHSLQHQLTCASQVQQLSCPVS